VQDPRVARLLDAVLAVTGDLDLESVLGRVVEAACALVGARYGALGVLGETEGLSSFVHRGIDDEQVARIGHLPEGRGVLGALVDDPEVLRLEDLSDDPRSVGFPAHHPPMRGFLGAPIRVREEVFGNLYLTEKVDGSPFTPQDEDLVVGLAAVAGVAIANARMVDDLRRREVWRDAVLDIAVSVLSGEPSEVAERRVVEEANRLLGGDGAAIIAARPGGTEVLASVGDAPVVGRRVTGTPADTVLNEGEPALVPRSELFSGAAVWVPVSERDETVAALGVGRSRRFTDEDVRLLGEFASQASLALAHERASADLQRLSLIEDRERIGRDLHDTVIQRLFATGLSLQSLTRRVEDRPEVSVKLAQAVDDVDATVKQIRSTIFALQAPADVGSVRVDLLRVTDEVATMLPRSPRVRFDGPVDTVVGPELAAQLVPVLREALTNVAKHARADEVQVDVIAVDGEVVLRVVDDGVGGVHARRGGFGLTNLSERARASGGAFEVSAPASGRGTEVVWRAPLA
jgi:signal transduction histidine kinase